jgi:site-specific DNA recombinase
MRVAIYVRVSTLQQQKTQTIEQQLGRLRAHIVAQGWSLDEAHIFRDDGYSGATLTRPGLDSLRDKATLAEFELVLITAPDRLARKYVHQALILDELERLGCRVEFLDRPMSDDPHDQLVLQIRGAVAEYERALIADRMRRGRLAKLRAGQLLPWTKTLYGYVLDAERPRDPACVRVHPTEAEIVRQVFSWYTDPEKRPSLYAIAKRLTDQGVPTPTGGQRWNASSIREMLKNPAYAGTAHANRVRMMSPRRRKSALLPVGSGVSFQPRPEEEQIPISVPAIIGQEQSEQAQARLALNQQMSRRNNTQQQYLLRGLVSCGLCKLACSGRSDHSGYSYYLCRGKSDALRAPRGERCPSRFIPTQALDDLVWEDLYDVVTHPESITKALARAQTGKWLPQQLQARSATLRQALAQLERQNERLLKAYLAEVIDLSELERKRWDIAQNEQALQTQLRQVEAQAEKRLEVATIATCIEAFCERVQQGLEQATFEQRRKLVELLIDRVVVTNDQVEIRYVIPTSEAGEQTHFCNLRTDYFDPHAQAIGTQGGLGIGKIGSQKPGFVLSALPIDQQAGMVQVLQGEKCLGVPEKDVFGRGQINKTLPAKVGRDTHLGMAFLTQDVVPVPAFQLLQDGDSPEFAVSQQFDLGVRGQEGADIVQQSELLVSTAMALCALHPGPSDRQSPLAVAQGNHEQTVVSADFTAVGNQGDATALGGLGQQLFRQRAVPITDPKDTIL